MPNISKAKKDKISEQILHYLFTISPNPIYTSKIAIEIARDEEFTKSLLQDLKNKGLIIELTKNKSGLEYLKRKRWLLSNQAYEIYKKHQSSSQQSL